MSANHSKSVGANGVRKEHLCVACNSVLKNPHFIKCGHRFCKSCIVNIKKDCEDDSQICPGCRDDNGNDLEKVYITKETKIFPDHSVIRDMEAQDVCDESVESDRSSMGLSGDFEVASNSPGEKPVDSKKARKDLRNKFHNISGQQNQPTANGQNTRVSEDLHERAAILDCKMTTCEGIVEGLNSQIEQNAQVVQILERQRRQNRELLESLERKIKAQDRIIALKDVTLAEQDLRIQSLEMASYDGVLVWKISNFNKKRQDALSGRTTAIYSPCFYTSRHGYKMCAQIYINGDGMGKGNHVSLFFVIMKGPFDALLRWPFRQKVTFMLLDQNNREHVIDAFRPDPTSSSFKRPTNDMNIASGCPLFMPISQLDSSRHAYVKDDAMVLKVIIDTSDLQ
ncbi:TNF receptor-associated factor 2-like [Glandiceps talaboti]